MDLAQRAPGRGGNSFPHQSVGRWFHSSTAPGRVSQQVHLGCAAVTIIQCHTLQAPDDTSATSDVLATAAASQIGP